MRKKLKSFSFPLCKTFGFYLVARPPTPFPLLPCYHDLLKTNFKEEKTRKKKRRRKSYHFQIAARLVPLLFVCFFLSCGGEQKLIKNFAPRHKREKSKKKKATWKGSVAIAREMSLHLSTLPLTVSVMEREREKLEDATRLAFLMENEVKRKSAGGEENFDLKKRREEKTSCQYRGSIITRGRWWCKYCFGR